MIHAETEEGYRINIPTSFCGYIFIKIIGLVKEEESGLLFCVRIIPKLFIEEKNLTDQIQKEIAVNNRVDHQNIIKLYWTFELKHRMNEFYIIILMEYCENCYLLSYTIDHGFKNKNEKYNILKGLSDAAKYIHSHGISHGDIKPENILIDSNFNIKLSYFSFQIWSDMSSIVFIEYLVTDLSFGARKSYLSNFADYR